MLLSLQGFRIRMIIALCHISGICPVEIDRLKMLVRWLMVPGAIFLRWMVLIPSGLMAVDELPIGLLFCAGRRERRRYC